ncbi:hypothetical protein F4803DRAFT_572351 [Xylaria telfairii]|nr:hypothetical protein F4803DRAFT_572351 [Xylaria telfairii]
MLVMDEYSVHDQYQVDLSGESPADVSSLQTSHQPPHDSAGLSMGWRPSYLRRLVLIGFISVFILIIITIEALLAISNRDHGLATSTVGKHSLWTYGPTAFLTGVAALWARTEYQSKLVAPWARLSQNPAPASRTLLLDYISQFPLFAIFRSLGNRDFIVSITLTVSVILKILITISTSLISVSWIALNQTPYHMLLLDGFVENDAKLQTTSTLASYMVRGLRDQNLKLPEGISGDYAFQSVQTNLPDTAETQVTVDGLVNSLSCQPVDLNLVGEGSPVNCALPLKFTISSPGCNVSVAKLPGLHTSSPLGSSTLFARFEKVQCDTIPDDPGKRILVTFGNITGSPGDVWISSDLPNLNLPNTYLYKSTSLLCVPEYAINRVLVTRNATQTKSVMPLPGAPQRMLKSVTAWDIMEAQFLAHDLVNALYDSSVPMSPPIDADPYMVTALSSQLEPGSQAIDLFSPDFLQNTANGYYRQIGAILAKKLLMDPSTTTNVTIGFATLNENRFVVSSWIAQWMVALVAICILLTAIALFMHPGKGYLPCSPTTFPAIISILLHSRQLLAQLRYAGASDTEHLVQFLRQSMFQSELAYDPTSNYDRFCVINKAYVQDRISNRFGQISSKLLYPLILHPACRFMVCLGVVSIIIALELLLRKSNLENGLGDVDNDTYIHYTWTAIPALALGLLSMVFAAVDFQVRTLAPYIALKQYVSRSVFKQLELLDMTVLAAMFREIRLGTLWALATTIAFLLASLFTTFSASLFQEISISLTMPLMLQPNRAFFSSTFTYHEVMNVTSTRPYNEIPSLILGSNYSFPRFTYMDLAFPELVAVTALPPNYAPNRSTISISAIIPAVRQRMDCFSYEPAQIHMKLMMKDDKSSHKTVLSIWIENEWSDRTDYDIPLPNDIDHHYHDNVTYIGLSSNSLLFYDVFYFWAKIDFGADPIVQHTAALSCNLGLEAMDMNTTFLGTGFDLDPHNPPQPLETTIRNRTINMDGDPITDYYFGTHYGDLAKVDLNPQQLDTFFAMLVTSPWAIPISALGDPSSNDDVIAAIQLQHRLIMAQRLKLLLAPVNKTNPDDKDTRRMINATVTDTAGRRRVFQDATSTHILVALLATALVLFIIGWVSGPSTDVLPREPTTIASVMALLAGGNIFDRLPPDTPFLSPEEIMTALGGHDVQFWMGWGNFPDEEGIRYGRENEAGVSQFGIFVADKEDLQQNQTD